jgi:hypothetical protein
MGVLLNLCLNEVFRSRLPLRLKKFFHSLAFDGPVLVARLVALRWVESLGRTLVVALAALVLLLLQKPDSDG